MNDNLQGILMGAVRAAAIFGGIMTLAPMLVMAERRICAAIQNRIGPNRVGPMGLLQPLADVIKLLFKEDVMPNRADRVLYSLGPFLAFAPAAIAFVAIPVGRGLQVADLSVGVLYVLAVTSLGVHGTSRSTTATTGLRQVFVRIPPEFQEVILDLVLSELEKDVFLTLVILPVDIGIGLDDRILDIGFFDPRSFSQFYLGVREEFVNSSRTPS